MTAFSVVVPTCNRPEQLCACLARLVGAGPGGIDTEIWVTDDSADNATRDMLAERFPTVRWLRGPRRGSAANRNCGARMTSSDWLIFCDDDCLPQPDLLAVYATLISANPELSVFEGAILADRPQQHPLEEAPINDKGGNLWSCNFAIRRKTFFEIGAFDERFPAPAGEDAELRHRLHQAGFVVRFEPAALVIHPWRRRSVRGFLSQQRRMREADLIAMSIHPELREVFTPYNVVKDVVRYYVRVFVPEIRRMGLAVLWLQPVLHWVYLRRFLAYGGLAR